MPTSQQEINQRPCSTGCLSSGSWSVFPDRFISNQLTKARESAVGSFLCIGSYPSKSFVLCQSVAVPQSFPLLSLEKSLCCAWVICTSLSLPATHTHTALHYDSVFHSVFQRKLHSVHTQVLSLWLAQEDEFISIILNIFYHQDPKMRSHGCICRCS